MSSEATKWAWSVTGISASEKLLLLALADRVNPEREPVVYPSNARLQRDTGLDRKTIMIVMAKLEGYGLISDTKQRAGTTGRVKVYRVNIDLNNPKIGTIKRDDFDDEESGGIVPKTAPLNGPKNGIVPKTESSQFSPSIVPIFPSNGPNFPDQLSQKRDIESKRNLKGISKESKKNTPSLSLDDMLASCLGLTEQVAKDYLAVRKAKRAGGVTATSWKAIEREAGKAGITFAQAVQVCAEKNWTGFDADWYRPKSAQQPINRHSGFDNKDYSKGVKPDGTF